MRDASEPKSIAADEAAAVNSDVARIIVSSETTLNRYVELSLSALAIGNATSWHVKRYVKPPSACKKPSLGESPRSGHVKASLASPLLGECSWSCMYIRQSVRSMHAEKHKTPRNDRCAMSDRIAKGVVAATVKNIVQVRTA
jgi:hypothetical protein